MATLVAPGAKLLQVTRTDTHANPGVDEGQICATLEKLRKIINNHVGIIELAEDLDIDTVTESFTRVKSAGARPPVRATATGTPTVTTQRPRRSPVFRGRPPTWRVGRLCV